MYSLSIDRDLRLRALAEFERQQREAMVRERALIGLAGTLSIGIFGAIVAVVLSW